MATLNKITINGREVLYADTIHHHTYSQFSFWDRIKILFGVQVHVHSRIFTKQMANVTGSEATVYIPPLIKRKPKPMALAGLEKSSSS